MAILKKEYELSIWNEELSSEGIKTEKKGMIIGAHDMEYLGRATNVKLKREIKGTNTLTFQMPSKFFDSKLGEYVKNEFVDYLFNEAKIKLKFMNQWFEFYVKKISEEKQFKSIMYNYTCEDSFINELSRTGYEIIFDEELYNNVDELGNFMEITLDNSIWDYRPDLNWGDFTEFNEERFYKIPLSLFGGYITGYPVILDVEKDHIKNTSWMKDKVWLEEGKTSKITIQNIYTEEERKLQYGDDLAREQRLFYDPYVNKTSNDLTDNGCPLLKGEAITIEDQLGYIYVPYTDLNYIYGNFIAGAYKATNTPAIYGTYSNSQNKYALQPYSTNPYDLIQFIYFSPEDEVRIDETGTIINNDCHYVITIEEWDSLVKKNFKINGEDKGYIHWAIDKSTIEDSGVENSEDYFESIYESNELDGMYYTKNVTPFTCLTDNFNWHPVYSEGYLSEINGIEVYAARKISITDRTELNKQLEKYVTVYNNNSEEYKDLYSENFDGDISNYRVCSSEETRMVLPTLAKNLVQNGVKITDENGWESRTQKSTENYNTGSYEELLSLTAKNLTYLGLSEEEIEEIEDTVTGEEQDESVSDFFLEITSPYVVKCEDLSAEGTVSEDIALNFGFTAQEKKIEKNKVYAVRLITAEEDKNGDIKYNINTDLNRLLIGQGSSNIEGNYTIQGYDKGVDDKEEYITFEGLSNDINMGYMPNAHAASNSSLYTETSLSYNEQKKEWEHSDGTISLKDSPYLLFKSDKTILNPYIGVKIESEPMELSIDNCVIETWGINDGTGMLFSVKAINPEDNKYYYVDGIEIGIVQVTSNYYDETLVNLANELRDNATEGEYCAVITEEVNNAFSEAKLKEGKDYSWTFESSSTQRNLFTTAACESENESISVVHAIYLNDIFYGLFWLKKNDAEDADIEDEPENEDAVTDTENVEDNTTEDGENVEVEETEIQNDIASFSLRSSRAASNLEQHEYKIECNQGTLDKTSYYEGAYYGQTSQSSYEWHGGKLKIEEAKDLEYLLTVGVSATKDGTGHPFGGGLTYGYEEKSYPFYNQNTIEYYISAYLNNSTSPGCQIWHKRSEARWNSKYIGVTCEGSNDGKEMFSEEWMKNKKHAFWFTGNSNQTLWKQIPAALYNHVLLNDCDFWQKSKGSKQMSAHTTDAPSLMYEGLKAGGYDGFYLGIGYYKNKSFITGDYYLICRFKGQDVSLNGDYGSIPSINVNSVEIIAGGSSSTVISNLSKIINNYDYKSKIDNVCVISCKTTGKTTPTKDKYNGLYYQLISGQSITLTTETLKEIINTDTSSTGGQNAGGTGATGSNTTEDFIDPELTMNPDTYINKYSLYNLYFRGAKPEIAEDIYATVDVDNCHLILNVKLNKVIELLQADQDNSEEIETENEDSSNENQQETIQLPTLSEIYFLPILISSENQTSSKTFFEKLDEILKIENILNDRPPFINTEIDNDSDWSLVKEIAVAVRKDIQIEGLKDILKSGDYKNLTDYFTMDPATRMNYELRYYTITKDNGKYTYALIQESHSINDYFEEINRASKYANLTTYNCNLLLSQTPKILNIYSLEIFEAYTRGRDFVEYDYTTLRAEETEIENKAEGNRAIFRDTNYFNYKYSGREFDIKRYQECANKPIILPGTNIPIAIVHSKDLLQENDVTLGDAYSYNRYFIEAIKYKEDGKDQYKDTFMVKDFVEEIDSTKYTEDDYEIVTSNIDLLQCSYYKPDLATRDNHWCDCAFNNNGTPIRECLYQKIGICPYRFQTEKHPRKIRTASIEKSNRFNITQELSKVFEIYPQFYIEYDEQGKILLDENGKMKKHIFFITEKGKTNHLGFRYEKNLNSISRTIDSASFTTKLFVEAIDSDLSDTGLCTIQNAEDNIGKNSYIMNFSYYTKKGILDAEKVERDLYGIEPGDMAFLPTIGYYNKKYDDLSNLIINIQGEAMTTLEAANIVRIEGITAALEERQKIAKTMYQFKIRNLEKNNIEYTTSDTYKNYLIKYKEQASILWSNVEEAFLSNDLFYLPKSNDSSQGEIIDLNTFLLEYFSQDSVNYLRNKYCNGELFWRLMFEGFDETDAKREEGAIIWNNIAYSSWQTFKEEIINKNLYKDCGTIGQYQGMLELVRHWKKTRAKYLNKINDLSEQFYKKYESFIKEGTWTDSNYLTDNEYYWAAEHVLSDSCQPQISYNITVVDLSSIPEYADDYTFELADTTFVEDIDFFGINPNTGLPNRQKVLLSAIDYNLDNPSTNSITVQNYTTSFEDLFESITAAVQSLTFNENTYKRASNFTSTHAVAQDSLQGALDEGDLTLLNTNDGNVVLNDEGASGSNISNNASKYKLTGEGLYFSKDGGTTWDMGVGPQGINADYIKLGQIDASKIQIMDSNYIYFLWDKSGITAYRNPSTSTNGLVDFTRFNKYGLSLIENNNIRLRAGYEFKTKEAINSTNSSGNYNEEADLSNQNIGFYLYNDSGIPIFKTETRSSYSDDTSTDYSARLSMTGEMFVTNAVLAGENDGSVSQVSATYNIKGAYRIGEVRASLLTSLNSANDLTKIIAVKNNIEIEEGQRKYVKIEGLESEIDYYYEIDENGLPRMHRDLPDQYYIYTLDITEKDSLEKQYHLKENIDTQELLLYISTENYKNYRNYLITKNVYGTTINPAEDGASIIIEELHGYHTETISYSQQQVNNTIPEITTLNDIINNYFSNQSYTISVIQDYLADYTMKIFEPLSQEEIAIYNMQNYSEDQPDAAIKGETKNLYKYSGIINTLYYQYWDSYEATGEYEVTQSTGLKTKTVGIFINNKKLQSTDSSVISLNNGGDIETIVSAGAERILSVCLTAEDTNKNQIVIRNIFSILKNGCCYFGGEVLSKNKGILQTKNLDYLPDEISIANPSMIIANDGMILMDYEKTYDLIRDNEGNVIDISDIPLSQYMMTNGGGNSNGNGMTISGYYLADPLG